MHQPVMVDQVIELLAIEEGRTFIDCTLGSGGHARAILTKVGAAGRLLGIDRDESALDRSRQSLARWKGQYILEHANFSDIGGIVEKQGLRDVAGIVMDLGISSDQLDNPDRGFSFMANGPLDMRMDREAAETASDLVNGLPQAELKHIFKRLGDEKKAGRVAAAIVREREIEAIRDTARLAAIVVRAKSGARHRRIHPATKVFQALRIAVNYEMESLEQALDESLPLLSVGGRMAVITFHSIEDRIVKNVFKAHVGHWESLQAGGREWHCLEPPVRLVNRKPIVPEKEEIDANPRSRSAKLRVVERIDKGSTYDTEN